MVGGLVFCSWFLVFSLNVDCCCKLLLLLPWAEGVKKRGT